MKLILKTKLLIACVLLIAISSCQKEGIEFNSETDYIIFGSSCGFCDSEGSASYLLKSDGLYKSIKYLNTGNPNTFTERLSEEKFNQIKGFDEKIPSEFFNEKKAETTFGCPDCADQGRLYLEINKGGQNKRFNIDTYTGSLPDHVKIIALEILAGIEIASK